MTIAARNPIRRVGVLGLGNWGTALADHIARKGIPVLGWTTDATLAESINSSARNPNFLSDVVLSKSLNATVQISELAQTDLIVVALPSVALHEVLPKLQLSSAAIVVSAVKGLERTTLKTPLQFSAQVMGAVRGYAVISGPSFARDIALQRPAGVVAASSDVEVSEVVADLFATNALRVYTSDDPIGVEVGGIVKNVIALAAGVCDGLGFGESARAGLITRGLAEMMRLAEAMGGRSQTLAGLSGLGDLAMTATSDLSRNRTVGVRLGRGEDLASIVKSIGSVAEAVESAPLVLKLADQYQVDMPITAHVVELLGGQKSITDIIQSMLSRPRRREF